MAVDYSTWELDALVAKLETWQAKHRTEPAAANRLPAVRISRWPEWFRRRPWAGEILDDEAWYGLFIVSLFFGLLMSMAVVADHSAVGHAIWWTVAAFWAWRMYLGSPR